MGQGAVCLKIGQEKADIEEDFKSKKDVLIIDPHLCLRLFWVGERVLFLL